jgi:FMN phosphatase YigB (HAD superfamily)
MPHIHCVIFDLDDTLYDCFGQRVRPSHRHAAEAMVRAGLKASVEAIYRARMKAFHHDPTLRHIDEVVCRQFGADGPEHDPERISRLARDAYFNLPVGNLKLFRGSLPLIHFLHHRGVRVFVVTFGEPEIQKAKVRVLGLENEPAVEHIYYADRAKALTKDIAFQKIQKKTGLPSGRILVVGDRPMSEIRAGKSLGMHTVRLKRGEFAAQKPEGPEEQPDYEVRRISEVKGLPFVFGKSKT